MCITLHRGGNHLDKKDAPEALKRLPKACATSVTRDGSPPCIRRAKDLLALSLLRLREHYNAEGYQLVTDEVLQFIRLILRRSRALMTPIFSFE